MTPLRDKNLGLISIILFIYKVNILLDFIQPTLLSSFRKQARTVFRATNN